MANTIGFCNQKGGTGKTTTVVNLASFLALAGKKTLVIDTDPQANATSGLGLDSLATEYSLYNVLSQGIATEEAVYTTNIRYLYILPSDTNLASCEIELVNSTDREYVLRNALAKAKENFEYILIDAPPSLGLLTINVLSAVDTVIIPMQCEYYALEGLSRLVQTLELVKERLNPGLEISGILLTMADFRTRLTLQVIDEVRKFFKDKVYDTVIPRNVKLSEAPSFGKPVYLHDPGSMGAKAYFHLACEILQEQIKGVYDGEESAGQRTRVVNTIKDNQSISSPGSSPSSTEISGPERIHLY